MTKYLFLLICINTFSAQLEIHFSGIKKVKGQVMIALHNNPESYPDQKKLIFQTAKPKLVELNKDNEFVCLFKDIPDGHYVVSAFHDINSDEKLNRSLFGAGPPSELYGFSNDAREIFSEPKYEDAEFEVKDNTQISILLK